MGLSILHATAGAVKRLRLFIQMRGAGWGAAQSAGGYSLFYIV
jgi:hypothetical protein